jgi:isopenicillin N synthase-like dioxygenase
VLTVPVIDISSFRMPFADGAARARVVRQVDEAARTIGFLQITGHGIPGCAVEELTAAIDAGFGLDLAQVKVCEVPDFEDAVAAWCSAAGTVARTMVRIFGVALGGSEDYFERYADQSIDILQISNYRRPGPAASLEQGQSGMAAHTDQGIVTVLWADHVPGLEILGADGVWHPVVPARGALLVNLGDALARWTKDQWISTTHRVVPPRVNGELVPRRSAAYCHDWPVALGSAECLRPSARGRGRRAPPCGQPR